MLTPAELVWLLAAVAKGDEAAFAALYSATCAKLYGVVLRILHRDELAAEILQETYLRVWREAGRYDPRRDSPMPWMVAMVRCHALDRLRGNPDATGADELEQPTPAEGPPAQRPFSEQLERLFSCIGRLPPEHQRLLLLAYYNGWSRDQLAAKFERPLSTVKTWLRRSLLDLRGCLAHE